MRIEDSKLAKEMKFIRYSSFKVLILGVVLMVASIFGVSAKEEGVGVSGESYQINGDMDEIIEKARKEREEKEVVLNGKCERVGRDCIEPGESRVINGKTVYRDCWRYTDAYRCKGYARNNCTEYDDVSYCNLKSTECKKKVGDWCVAQNRVYDCEESEKYIRKEKRYRPPSFKRDNIEERRRVICGEEIKCIDGKCFDMSYKANDEMGEAAGMLATLKEMQGEWDANGSVFKGNNERCDKKIVGYTNCCTKLGGWGKMLGAKCNERDKNLAKMKQEERCIEIGTYCSSKVLGACVIKRTTYCCYDSKIAREINKQSREKGLISKSWGDVESPNCTGFSIEELQGIDFEKIDFEFLSEDIKKKNIWSRMGDMKKALEHTQRLMEGEISAIKEDVVAEGGTGDNSEDVIEKDETEVNVGKSDINEQTEDVKKTLKHAKSLMKDEFGAIQEDVAEEGAGVNIGKSNTNEQTEDQKLYEKKFSETKDLDKSRQKKPYGRDRSKDTGEEEVLYNKEDVGNRDYEGL